jgi:hypothetical protein
MGESRSLTTSYSVYVSPQGEVQYVASSAASYPQEETLNGSRSPGLHAIRMRAEEGAELRSIGADSTIPAHTGASLALADPSTLTPRTR